MARPLPVIDSHPQKQRIIDALLAGESSRSISAWSEPRIGHAAINRYAAKVVRPALKSVAKRRQDMEIRPQVAAQITEIRAEARGVIAADPILDRVRRKYERYDRAAQLAESKEDVGGMMRVDTAETQALRLHAELEGRLNGAPQVVNNTLIIAMPALPAEAEVVDVEPVE